MKKKKFGESSIQRTRVPQVSKLFYHIWPNFTQDQYAMVAAVMCGKVMADLEFTKKCCPGLNRANASIIACPETKKAYEMNLKRKRKVR